MKTADIRQSTDYSPFGVTLDNRNLTLAGAEKIRYGFNGKELDNEIKREGNSYDFGARMLDPRLGRWLTTDPLSEKYPSHSTYNFVMNTPIIAVDPNGKDVIIVIYTNGSDDYRAAAWTRVREIKASKGFNKTKDKVILMHVPDLGKLEQMVDAQLNAVVKSKDKEVKVRDYYGKTRELSYYGHGAKDGPVGEVKASGNENMSLESGNKLDENQLTMKGWGAIDFNFGENSTANFYGCNMTQFASRFAVFQKSTYTSGYGAKAGLSSDPNTFNAAWNTISSYKYLYLWDGDGLEIYNHKPAGSSEVNEDDDHDGYLDIKPNDPTDPQFWNDNPTFSIPISSGKYSTNFHVTPKGEFKGYEKK